MLETNTASHEESNILVNYWQGPPSEDLPMWQLAPVEYNTDTLMWMLPNTSINIKASCFLVGW